MRQSVRTTMYRIVIVSGEILKPNLSTDTPAGQYSSCNFAQKAGKATHGDGGSSTILQLSPPGRNDTLPPEHLGSPNHFLNR